MNGILLFLIFLACTPLIIFLLQMIFSRAVKDIKIAPQIAVIMCSVAGFFVIIGTACLINSGLPTGCPKGRISFILYGCIVYASLALMYFHIFNMSETARRIRILYEIYLVGKANKDKVRERYGASKMIKIRMGRLVDSGQVACRNGRFFIRNRLLYLAARIVMAWRGALKFNR